MVVWLGAGREGKQEKRKQLRNERWVGKWREGRSDPPKHPSCHPPSKSPKCLPPILGSVQASRKGGPACTRVTHQVFFHNNLVLNDTFHASVDKNLKIHLYTMKCWTTIKSSNMD